MSSEAVIDQRVGTIFLFLPSSQREHARYVIHSDAEEYSSPKATEATASYLYDLVTLRG